MKKYIEPKLQVVNLDSEAILAASVGIDRSATTSAENDFGAKKFDFDLYDDEEEE